MIHRFKSGAPLVHASSGAVHHQFNWKYQYRTVALLIYLFLHQNHINQITVQLKIDRFDLI